tara:strand:+ start:104 stop:2092 length:1989 start_codon:yes stop_codon:yes gene_type:complete
MSYHDLYSNTSLRTVNDQGQKAPAGYHYMPDGTLMLDSEMILNDEISITGFDLDLSDLPATSERRRFNILGNRGAEFILEIKDNTTGYYYNFVTNVFQVSPSRLEEQIAGNSYNGSITFPAVTGGDDQYDVYLYAKPGTIHAAYSEVRFGDGSLDINNSTGSNSLMMQKAIYQYAALTLTLQGYSIGNTVPATPGGYGTDTISINRGKPQVKTAFSFTTTAATNAAYRILKQPVANDVLAFIEPVVGSAPIDLPGENIYPAVSDTDTVDGATTTATKIVMDNNVADNIVFGDKITVETTDLTDTVDGTVSGVKIVMDSNVATKMAVGDRVLGLRNVGDTTLVQVVALDPDGDNAKEFQIDFVLGGGAAGSAHDGSTLTFQPKCNRQLFTVAALNPDADNVKEFSYVADDGGGGTFGVRDGATLSFSNRMNYSWPINNYADVLKEGMVLVPGTNVTADTSIGVYEDTLILFEGTKEEKTIIKNTRPALNTLAKKPTVVKGLVTVQEGQVVFDKQQALALAGTTLKVGGYGESEILRVYGWEVKFTDLAIALTAPTTTTREATSAHAVIDVNSKEGVINNVSRVSGIGINSALQNPLITAGGGATGTGDWTMDAVQTLENGITLTVENTSRVATITGNIEIVKAGYADQTLRFDINKLLSTSAP